MYRFEPNSAIIARYARGRDYHKVMRGRLKTFTTRIKEKMGDFESAPVCGLTLFLKKSLARKCGHGMDKNAILTHS